MAESRGPYEFTAVPTLRERVGRLVCRALGHNPQPWPGWTCCNRCDWAEPLADADAASKPWPSVSSGWAPIGGVIDLRDPPPSSGVPVLELLQLFDALYFAPAEWWETVPDQVVNAYGRAQRSLTGWRV